MKLDWLLPEPWLWGPTVFWKKKKKKFGKWRHCVWLFTKIDLWRLLELKVCVMLFDTFETTQQAENFCCERNACSVGLNFGYNNKGSSKCSYIPCQGNNAFFFTLQLYSSQKVSYKVSLISASKQPRITIFQEYFGFPVCHVCVLSCFSLLWLFATPWLWPTRLLCPWDYPGKNTGGVAMPSSRGSSWPRDRTHISYISCTDRQVLYH